MWARLFALEVSHYIIWNEWSEAWSRAETYLQAVSHVLQLAGVCLSQRVSRGFVFPAIGDSQSDWAVPICPQTGFPCGPEHPQGAQHAAGQPPLLSVTSNLLGWFCFSVVLFMLYLLSKLRTEVLHLMPLDGAASADGFYRAAVYFLLPKREKWLLVVWHSPWWICAT